MLLANRYCGLVKRYCYELLQMVQVFLITECLVKHSHIIYLEIAVHLRTNLYRELVFFHPIHPYEVRARGKNVVTLTPKFKVEVSVLLVITYFELFFSTIRYVLQQSLGIALVEKRVLLQLLVEL